MALPETLLNTGTDAITARITSVSLHSADPGGTGANETTAGRQTPSWSSAASGDASFSASFTGGAADGPCTHAGFWEGTTFLYGEAITGDQAFNAAGQYDLTHNLLGA